MNVPKGPRRLKGRPGGQNKSTDQQRPDTLYVINDDDGSVMRFPVNERRMRSICSKWQTLPSFTNGCKRLRIEAVNFKDENAKDALRSIIDIIHRRDGNRRHYTDANPRLLFYSALIHESLGASHNLTYPGDKEYYLFFPPRRIKHSIFDLMHESKYLYRVRDWLLLAVVADRLKLNPIMGLIHNSLALFCRADRLDMPRELRHGSMNDVEWALIKELRLIDDQMLQTRLQYVERIFHALRLLSHQVENMDKGILPTQEQFEVYQEYSVAPCSECYSISSKDFHQRLPKASLWPLFDNSYTMYQGSVIDVIRKIRGIGEDMVDEAKRHRQRGRYCNQLTHLYRNTRKLRKELIC
ncbi:hypothetical protein NXS19_009965 [Fusarium pseudograminearum]|uniref:Uncharacterized protein n=1 Tax=Fusarium pseudograminearum (strain CS3096) TaxID=1028729 RepID=K3VVZ4_FUSPC|nr:hypothetical protein FPSE_00905 [Fusarium pseudograminearum CS3096]EKJ78938.1 hypothetical protein FPSE_00905 [Fusarium pseudograminearum CS3096]UZP42149.1 hypothetical protein NXS19_009965 [Fusarium pseudograminearum]